MRPFFLIVACDQQNGIGVDGKLPWHLPADLKYFKKITTAVTGAGRTNAVIMGRVTWESIPPQYRPLPERVNLILSRNAALSKPQGVLQSKSLDDALAVFARAPFDRQVENIFVIGGQQIFKVAIGHPLCQKIYLTQILATFTCDAFFPAVPKTFQEVYRSETFSEKTFQFYFSEFTKR